MRTKRYQLRSDRALGLVFDDRCNIEQIIYLNAPDADSREMDALVEAMQLQPTGDKSSATYTSFSPTIHAAFERQAAQTVGRACTRPDRG